MFQVEMSNLRFDFWLVKQNMKAFCRRLSIKKTISLYQMSSGHPYFIRSSSTIQNMSAIQLNLPPTEICTKSVYKGENLRDILSYLSFPM